jgi:putative transposase
MAKLEHYHTKFEEGYFYHIYNRTVDKQLMFRNEGNYEFFLKKYDEYLSPVIETYAYCLLGNHFHLLIRVRTDFSTWNKQSQKWGSVKSIHDIVSHQFRKFFQSYSMAFNKQHDRVGTLFQTPFKRVLVNKDNYFTQLVYYIHSNPQHHQLTDDFREWKWSSYNRILLDRPSRLQKQELIAWFGDKQSYKDHHDQYHDFLLEEKLMIDDHTTPPV